MSEKMFIRLIILTCFLFAGGHYIAAQNYNNIINYRWEQGFAAASGYSLGQDKNGYIWIGSENGLMRFNGYQFKGYTTRDGLPDNEIVGMKANKEGALWLVPFANDIAYIQDGTIKNRQNDAALARLSIGVHIREFFFDGQGNVWIFSPAVLWCFSKGRIVKVDKVRIGKTVVRFESIDKLPGVTPSGKFVLGMGNVMYQWNGSRFVEAGRMPFVLGYYHCLIQNDLIYDYRNGRLAYYKEEKETISFSGIHSAPKLNSVSGIARSGNRLFLGAGHKVIVMDVDRRKWVDSFSFGCKAGSLLLARDSSLWIGTIGKGIFRVTQTPVKAIKGSQDRGPVTFVKGTAEGMYAITNQSFLLESTLGNKEVMTATRINQNIYLDYVYATKDKFRNWILCGDRITKSKVPGKGFQTYRTGTFKSVVQETEDLILGGTNERVIRIRLSDMKLLDTLYDKRVMAIAKVNDTVYAGTANGLVAIPPNKRYYAIAKGNPLLQQRILALCPGKNGMLWCANNRGVLVGLRHDSIIAVVGLRAGLQCNRISSLNASGAFIWVGTDNGLFAITQNAPHRIVKHITHTTGLNSDQVNALDVYGKRVWVGTTNGINYFDEDDVFKGRRDTTMIIVNNIANGTRILHSSKNELRLKAQTLTVDFDVVDFSGGTRPVFQYKLDNSNWVTLESNHLYFPSLPYGKFTLRIRAYSSNWTDGVIYSQDFYNPSPFYKSWWFIGLLMLAIVIVVVLVLLLLIRRMGSRYRQKLMLQQNLLHLEQMALRGQMNPHFIFNCISAIKQYYSAGNIDKANSFVDSFSLLIRQTFEMGTETFVSLDKELNYLARYLEVEKTRFNDSFRYSITRNTQLDETELLVPAMLLQPIVENAVRHGVRHLPDGEGEIAIAIVQKDQEVVIRIEDNGIGRKKSNELKTHPFLRLVTSTVVNKQRIDLLNRLLGGKLVMHTTDLYEDKEVSGTKVIISYPVNIKEILKDEDSYHRR